MLRIVALVVFGFALMANDQMIHARTLTVGGLHANCRLLLKQPAKLDARKLSKQNVADMAICSAFIAGFNFGKFTANEMNGTLGPYCLPYGYERGDRLVRNFVRWAARNKRHRRKAAGFGILKSLQERYACDERDRKK